jgi:hypothetical protein
LLAAVVANTDGTDEHAGNGGVTVEALQQWLEDEAGSFPKLAERILNAFEVRQRA